MCIVFSVVLETAPQEVGFSLLVKPFFCIVYFLFRSIVIFSVFFLSNPKELKVLFAGKATNSRKQI